MLSSDGREHGGHIAFPVGNSDDIMIVHDHCEVYPVRLSLEEFESVSWSYFVSTGRS